MIQIGDAVAPVTPAGLWLSAEPCDGTFGQPRRQVCVFRGRGVVIAVHDIIIDYAFWPDVQYADLGRVPFRNCYVCCDAGEGWAGAGALQKLESAARVEEAHVS